MKKCLLGASWVRKWRGNGEYNSGISSSLLMWLFQRPRTAEAAKAGGSLTLRRGLLVEVLQHLWKLCFWKIGQLFVVGTWRLQQGASLNKFFYGSPYGEWVSKVRHSINMWVEKRHGRHRRRAPFLPPVTPPNHKWLTTLRFTMVTAVRLWRWIAEIKCMN